MKAHEAEKLIEAIRSFIEPPGHPTLLTPPVKDVVVHPAKNGDKPRGAGLSNVQHDELSKLNADQIEKLYQLFKSRFIDDAKTDPVLLRLMTAQPEIIVELEPKIVTLDGSSTKGRAARLVAARWFKESRTGGAVRSDLKRTGTDPGTPIYEVLNGFVRDGFLERAGDGYVEAPGGVKVTERTIERA